MMMRPRNYSVLNRSIARGLTYALRDSNTKKYKTNKTNQKTNVGLTPEDEQVANVIGIICVLILLTIFLAH